ncbi:phosphatase PAP2 family protein [Clostridium sp. OS1-26]|uniref:phosphatase PAP2 family protein n=1 Tax=Clostridium sp. OS1-26 TaxID=3070681 RepID=UPI0027DEB5AB|nr:phosphatase PAP2 family protein [Clostridium sp. OS1-26]WML37413.1 phosphatase PAP2 family protein [Clostridium sp. OS1-26]
MNLELFRIINNLATKHLILDKIMIIFSQYVPIFFALILCGLYILGVKMKIPKLKYIVSSTILLLICNFIISYIIGVIHYFPRPFVNNNVNLLIPHKPTSSFPSSHSIGVMTIALGINKRIKSLGIILILLSIFVGFSRIYVGHHYPLDVIGGFTISFISNILYTNFIESKLIKKLLELKTKDVTC